MSSGGWEPNEQGVQQIVGLLVEFQQPGANQAQVLAQLEQCKVFPDFNNYLAFIFASGEGLPVEVRQSAGLLLKNNLRAQYSSLSEAYRMFIKASLLRMLGHPSKPLRQTAGTCAASVVVVEGVAGWPALLPALAEALDSGDTSRLEGALDTVYKVCEEAPLRLEADLPGPSASPGGPAPRGSDALVPRVLAAFASPAEEARALAVGCANLLAGIMPRALFDSLDTYLQGLFSLAHDPSARVRKAVCAGLVAALAAVPDRLAGSMPQLIDYMLQSTQDGDEGVALESCEFWSAFCESQLEPDELRPFLPRLLPLLLRNMVWEEGDEEVLEAEMLEARALAGGGGGAPDRDDELRPFIHRAAAHGSGAGPKAGEGGTAAEEEEEEGDDDDEEEVGSWNLRRCSAAGLDALSALFGDELLPVIMPVVQQRLQESDWRARESAILALGAVSEGCAAALLPNLTQLVGLLLPALRDPRPLVRCIACWALTRYSRWLLERAQAGQRAELDAIVQGLCERVGDHNRRVQSAACGSVATLAEEAEDGVAPYLQAMLHVLGAAVRSYPRKSLRSAYDALSSISEHCRGALADCAGADALLRPLADKLDSLPDGDPELLPLLECLAAVAPAAGAALEAHAEALFGRCLGMAERAAAGAAAGALDPEEAAQHLTVALDVLSGLAEGLGPSVESLVGRSGLRELLLSCLGDASPDVRQSAFALVGDLARSCAPHLRPAAPALLQACMGHMEPGAIGQATMSACNNAVWAAGELAVKLPAPELAPSAEPLLQRLLCLLSCPPGALPRSLVENSAITLGRVAWICPEPLAPYAPHLLGPWCLALRNIRDDVEKEHAFLGLCAVLRINPQGAAAAFVPLLEAVASWRQVACEGLRHELLQLLQGYKAQLSATGQWDSAVAAASPAVRQKLADAWGV